MRFVAAEAGLLPFDPLILFADIVIRVYETVLIGKKRIKEKQARRQSEKTRDITNDEIEEIFDYSEVYLIMSQKKASSVTQESGLTV